ncbi:hypothetical protein ACG873_24950 [Mesorhizobium sp. AaZ16]|uniref:hypothetical protein n=1 Tax=Mesorhizobium sp. AaZ16 TaxID=3402289 RepID=UPI00374EC602
MSILGPLEWHRFANGDFLEPIRVCRLAPEFVNLLGAKEDRILIHPGVAPKLVFKHKLTAFQMPMIPIAADLGAVVQDRNGALSFFYDDQNVFGKIFHLAVKTTSERHEIWISTFHKIRNDEYVRRLKKGRLVRPQK